MHAARKRRSAETFARVSGDQRYHLQDPAAWPFWGLSLMCNAPDLGFGTAQCRDPGVKHVGRLGGGGAGCELGHTYLGEGDAVCGGADNWQATQMEVWSVPVHPLTL
eukprot:COSAG05_NODE_97_length_19444_cov_8.577174_16_plen_107_part_00